MEVAKKFGVTQPAISERVAALRNSGLLKEEIASAIKSSSSEG
jgi:predicted transcriptional regulator